VEINIIPKENLSTDQKRDLEALLTESFKDDVNPGYQWAQPAIHVLAYAAGKLACHAGILGREILVGGNKIHIAGVTDVATEGSLRRKGFARSVLKAMENYLKTEGVCMFALLFCDARLLPLYQGCGYRRITAPLFIHSEGRRFQIDDVKLALPLTADEWPQGEIDLLGLPW
jgi:GNAT superfamily N-acetyltransferase